MATGRSDYPNQINNVLCFPGIFRGALDAGATEITEEMKLAAAQAASPRRSPRTSSPRTTSSPASSTATSRPVVAAVVDEAKRDGIARLNEETGTFATVEVRQLRGRVPAP